jgi:ABC-type sugar transport system substrate-binding protein
MKRNLAVALSFLALLVGGCSTTAAPTSSASSSPGVSATGRHIAFFVPWTEDVWYVVAIDGAKAAAANLGVQLDVFDASNKLEQQIQQFDAAIAAKPEAIAWYPASRRRTTPASRSSPTTGPSTQRPSSMA